MEDKNIILKDFVKENSRKVRLADMEVDQGFIFLDDKMLEIKKKIEKSGDRLGEMGDRFTIAKGIHTGCNDVFLVGKKYYDELKLKSEYESSFLHRCIRGRDVNKYKIREIDTYVIVIPNGWTDKNNYDNKDPEIFFKEELPNVHKYLTERAKEYEKIKSGDRRRGAYTRSDQGKYWWELRSFKDYGIFDRPKLMYKVIGRIETCVDTSEGIVLAPAYFGYGSKVKEMSCVMNTNIFMGIYGELYSNGELSEGAKLMHMYAMKNMVVPKNIDKVGLDKKYEFIEEKLGDGACINKLEQEVEKIVQELYGLTDEEVEYLCK